MSLNVHVMPQRADEPSGGSAPPARTGFRREAIIEEAEGAIVLRTVSQAVARAQALSRKFTAGKAGATVDDFLAGRRRAANVE